MCTSETATEIRYVRNLGVGTFNVSAPSATMREIVIAICQALGRPAPHLGIPLHLLEAAGAITRRMGDPGRLGQRLQKFTHNDVYDGQKGEPAFGFCSSVSLSEGMRREVDDLRSRTRL
jgi:nucleoside-diphosphate-sugar epimerase